MVRRKGSTNSVQRGRNQDKIYELRPKTSIARDLGASITQGFGFGMGSSLARSIFGGNKLEIESKESQLCENDMNIYRDCVKRGAFDCMELYKNYESCIKSSK
jgi:hypothetical protein